MSFPDTSLIKGEVVTLPLRVEDFNRIVSIEFTLSWDPTVLRFQGSEDADLVGVAIGDTRSADGILRFSWFSITEDFVTLPDGSSIINLMFFVNGEIGDATNLSIDNLPFQPIEIAQATTSPDEVVLLELTDEVGTATVINAQELVVRAIPTNVTCQGGNNGSIRLDIQGATGQLSAEWVGPNGFESAEINIDNLAPGVYRVTLFDADRRIVFIETLRIRDSDVIVTVDEVEILGYDCTNNLAIANVLVSGGVQPYSFDLGIRQPQESSIFNSLSPRDYVVTVTDANNCQLTESFSVPEFQKIALDDIEIEGIDCNSGGGTATFSVSGGIPPYRFNLGDGEQASSTFVNLAPQAYVVTITDANDCFIAESFTITPSSTVTLTEIELGEVNCSTGRRNITLNVQGGIAPFQYITANRTQGNPEFLNLSPGTYTATVIDANTCSSTRDFTIPEYIPMTIGNIVIDAEACETDNAQITFNVSGGVPPYNYQLNNLAQRTPVFQNIAPGNYRLTVSDANGCQVFEDLTVDGEPSLAIQSIDIAATSCITGLGSAIVNAQGGLVPYQFDIGNGVINNGQFNNLTPGNYSVTLTDNNNCEVVSNFQIEDPNTFGSDSISIGITNCDTRRGSARVFITTGTAPYSFDLGGGTSSQDRFDNLTPGDYNLTITDSEGCTSFDTFTIPDPRELRIEQIETEVTDCDRNLSSASIITSANNNGSLIYNIGRGPTQNNTFEDLVPGNYTVTVTDAGSCSDTATFVVQDIGSFNTILGANLDLCRGETGTLSPGKFEQYFWSTGETTETIEVSAPGRYSVTVSDGNGCFGQDAIDVTIVPDLDLVAEQSDILVCPGESVLLSAMGAETYSWVDTSQTILDTLSNNTIATPYFPTNYQLVGSNTCETDSVELFIDILPVDVSVEPKDSCIAPGTIIRLVVNGGIRYKWLDNAYPVDDPSARDPRARPEETTTYFVAVTDENNCTVMDSTTILVAAQPEEILLPNVITPNGDDKNDVLVFNNILKYGQNSLRVFNRWGDVVFEKVNYMLDEERFDGTRNGQFLPAGNYYYVLAFRTIEFRQTLTVIRE